MTEYPSWNSVLFVSFSPPRPGLKAPVRYWGASEMHHHPVWARHQSAPGWFWWKGHLWSAQEVGRYVSYTVTYFIYINDNDIDTYCMDWLLIHRLYVAVAKVVTTKVTWTFWPRRSRSWQSSREKLSHPSSTWVTCRTSFSEPSEQRSSERENEEKRYKSLFNQAALGCVLILRVFFSTQANV